jgi:hypothetical protein
MEGLAVATPGGDILYFAYVSSLLHASLSTSIDVEVGPRSFGPAKLNGYRLGFSYVLGGEKAAPLGERRGAVWPEVLSAGERALVAELVVVRGIGGCELLQPSHAIARDRLPAGVGAALEADADAVHDGGQRQRGGECCC